MRAQSAPRADVCEPGAWEFLGDIFSELVKEEVRRDRMPSFSGSHLWVTTPTGVAS